MCQVDGLGGATSVDVSVVMPVRNGAATIGEQLDALSRQRPTCSWELVVADNGSTDSTIAVVESHPIGSQIPLRIADAFGKPGINVGRNAGVRSAQGAIVLFCDCDDAVETGWIEAYWRQLGGERPAVAAGKLDLAVVNDPRMIRWGNSLLSPARHPSGFPYGWGANFGLHVAAWEEVGGFDESFQLGFDEVEFFARAFRAGIPYFWVADALVHYRITTPPLANLSKSFRYGRAEARFRELNPEQAGPQHTPVRAALSLARTASHIPVRRPIGPSAARWVRSISHSAGRAWEVVSSTGS